MNVDLNEQELEKNVVAYFILWRAYLEARDIDTYNLLLAKANEIEKDFDNKTVVIIHALLRAMIGYKIKKED